MKAIFRVLLLSGIFSVSSVFALTNSLWEPATKSGSDIATKFSIGAGPSGDPQTSDTTSITFYFGSNCDVFTYGTSVKTGAYTFTPTRTYTANSVSIWNIATELNLNALNVHSILIYPLSSAVSLFTSNPCTPLTCDGVGNVLGGNCRYTGDPISVTLAS